MASKFPPGVFAAALSVFPAKTLNLIFYWWLLLPPFTKASTTPFISPWSPETAAAVAALPPQVQQLLEEFPSLLHPSAAPPKTLQGVVHHIHTDSAAPVFARSRSSPATGRPALAAAAILQQETLQNQGKLFHF